MSELREGAASADATMQPGARAMLDVARRRYLLSIQACIIAGVPNDELTHDEDATHRAAAQLLAMAGAA